jgi:hypothetical protein
MPDWLSSSVEAPPAASSIEEASSAEPALEAGALPSWVQAMRPVEAVAAGLSSSATPEARGALAGLQGVLPAAPNYAPTSKPKPYSLRLQATNDQLSQAALLEQIIAAETSPVPIASFAPLGASRGLRWFIAFIFFITTFAILFMRTQIFSLPVDVPLEVGGALQVTQSIPEGAPVLVAFDYEPARAGEMEAAAAPVFDQLILLRHPHLVLISTSETGTMLGESFITGPMLAGHGYQRGNQYANLGYLPGGQMGIRAFTTTPFDALFKQAWNSGALKDVNSFVQFKAFIIVTDNADTARAWIEQTSFAHSAMPVLVISSAQSAPMIQPYYASGQVNGMVNGLHGGAIFEQNNAGRPGTTRIYWDAYSIGMLLAMALILGGGLWSLFMGTRDRAAARETNS